eukprot:CAMPEP_0172030028 /NCGR_PEP_ID=MMETSP1041-20130122/18472_1 /TAXON_ID=464988 /ORGANISM="Hemiselmis andersenii, Strain CCMP439" /LENGTH=82 /DNA_ID=CAMNT_0012686283 /DNA_START=109 /DNA_END=354 /DNA_ORIENTATION=-
MHVSRIVVQSKLGGKEVPKEEAKRKCQEAGQRGKGRGKGTAQQKAIARKCAPSNLKLAGSFLGMFGFGAYDVLCGSDSTASP